MESVFLESENKKSYDTERKFFASMSRKVQIKYAFLVLSYPAKVLVFYLAC